MSLLVQSNWLDHICTRPTRDDQSMQFSDLGSFFSFDHVYWLSNPRCCAAPMSSQSATMSLPEHASKLSGREKTVRTSNDNDTASNMISSSIASPRRNSLNLHLPRSLHPPVRIDIFLQAPVGPCHKSLLSCSRIHSHCLIPRRSTAIAARPAAQTMLHPHHLEPPSACPGRTSVFSTAVALLLLEISWDSTPLYKI